MNKEISIEEVADKKIIQQTNGITLTFNELKNKPILFSTSSIWSDDCIQMGYVVIEEKYKTLIKKISEKNGLELDFSNLDIKDIARVGYHKTLSLDESPLSTKEKVFFFVAKELNKFVFDKVRNLFEGGVRKMNLGDSDISEAWTNGHSHITISLSEIKKLNNINDAIISLWMTMCHEYAHCDSTIEEDYHNDSFYELYHRITQQSAKYIPRCLEVLKYGKIKEKYQIN